MISGWSFRGGRSIKREPASVGCPSLQTKCMRCRVMAPNGPPAVSAVWSLSGGEADMAVASADFRN